MTDVSINLRINFMDVSLDVILFLAQGSKGGSVAGTASSGVNKRRTHAG